MTLLSQIRPPQTISASHKFVTRFTVKMTKNRCQAGLGGPQAHLLFKLTTNGQHFVGQNVKVFEA